MASEQPMEACLVTGTVVLPDGAIVPADANITVQVQDTSLADAPAVVIGEQQLTSADVVDGQIPYAVECDGADIDDGNMYTMSVRIEDGAGELLYINDTSIPVLTDDAPTTDVVVPVIAVQSASVGAGPRAISLEASSQVLFLMDGEPFTDIAVTPGETVVFVVENTAGFSHNFTIGTDDELSAANSAGQAGIPTWSSGVQELEWTVPDDVTGLMFGCTVPGHYSNMQGSFTADVSA